MKKRHALTGMFAALVTASSVMAVPAFAQPSPVLTYAQATNNPNVVKANSIAENITMTNFFFTGSTLKPDFTNGPVLRFQRSGSTMRLSETTKKRTTITYTNGFNTCARVSTADAPNTHAGDMEAVFTCHKGAPKNIVRLLNNLTPVNFLKTSNSDSRVTSRFTAEAPTGQESGSVIIKTYTVDDKGEHGYMVYSMRAPTSDLPYTVNVFRSGRSSLGLWSKPLPSEDALVPFSELKKVKQK